MHKELTKKSVNTEKVNSPKPPILRLTLDPHRTAANILGMLYISRKRSVTNPEGIGGKSNKIVGGKSCHQQTREEVAKETGVSPRTIANDAAYAEAAS